MMEINILKIYIAKNLHSAMCQILIDGWQLMMLAWHHGCNCNGVASSWKWIVLTKLQLNCNDLHYIYDELQFYNSCNLSINTHMSYKYSEWQVFSAIQKLRYKANYKTPIFFILCYHHLHLCHYISMKVLMKIMVWTFLKWQQT